MLEDYFRANERNLIDGVNSIIDDYLVSFGYENIMNRFCQEHGLSYSSSTGMFGKVVFAIDFGEDVRITMSADNGAIFAHWPNGVVHNDYDPYFPADGDEWAETESQEFDSLEDAYDFLSSNGHIAKRGFRSMKASRRLKKSNGRLMRMAGRPEVAKLGRLRAWGFDGDIAYGNHGKGRSAMRKKSDAFEDWRDNLYTDLIDTDIPRVTDSWVVDPYMPDMLIRNYGDDWWGSIIGDFDGWHWELKDYQTGYVTNHGVRGTMSEARRACDDAAKIISPYVSCKRAQQYSNGWIADAHDHAGNSVDVGDVLVNVNDGREFEVSEYDSHAVYTDYEGRDMQFASWYDVHLNWEKKAGMKMFGKRRMKSGRDVRRVKFAFNEHEFIPSEWEYLGRNDDDFADVFWNGRVAVYRWDDGQWSLMEDLLDKIEWYKPAPTYGGAVDNWIDEIVDDSWLIWEV